PIRPTTSPASFCRWTGSTATKIAGGRMSNRTSNHPSEVESQHATMNDPTVHDLFDLRGLCALVTGASGHRGQSMARALAEAGARVVAASRQVERARQIAAALPSPGGARHLAVQLNHLDEESLNRGFDDAVAEAGAIDVLVNNGQQGHALDWTNVTAEAFNRDLQNATGYFLLARRLRDHAVERGEPGCVIMIGSMYGVVGSYPDAYAGIHSASPVQYH